MHMICSSLALPLKKNFPISKMLCLLLLSKIRHSSSSSFKAAVEASEKIVKPPSKTFHDPFSIVSHEMSNLAMLIANLIGSGHPMLNRVSSYYFEAEGKNVRPLIVLLLSRTLLKIPVEERNRISIDSTDVVDQSVHRGTLQLTVVAGKSVNNSISPLRVLHGINPRVILNPLSKPMDSLPEWDAANGILPVQRRLAEIVEMIHTASLLHDDVIDEPFSGKAHRHKTGQRSRLQEAAVRGLNPIQHAQAASDRQIPQHASDRVPGRTVVMPHLPDRNQCRQRVTHNRQSHRLIKIRRQAREFERQRRNPTPLDKPRECAVSQNRHRKRLVLAVAGDDRRNSASVVDVLLRPVKHFLKP